MQVLYLFRPMLQLHKTSYRCNGSVCSIVADLDSVSGVGRVYNLSISHVDCDMTAVADQISWLCICIGNFSSCILLLIGSSRKADAEVCIYALYEPRAVSTICQACSAPYIWISNKLTCIIYNCRTGSGSCACTSGIRRTAG